ncbi:unnamed protein product [Rhodiola kirilowii]
MERIISAFLLEGTKDREEGAQTAKSQRKACIQELRR